MELIELLTILLILQIQIDQIRQQEMLEYQEPSLIPQLTASQNYTYDQIHQQSFAQVQELLRLQHKETLPLL
jgi:hypothetical protein